MVPVHNAPVRVLIASRSPALSAGIAAFLPDSSLDVELAGTVEEALAGLAAADHDLVIIDRGLARALVAGAAAGLGPVRSGRRPSRRSPTPCGATRERPRAASHLWSRARDAATPRTPCSPSRSAWCCG